MTEGSARKTSRHDADLFASLRIREGTSNVIGMTSTLTRRNKPAQNDRNMMKRDWTDIVAPPVIAAESERIAVICKTRVESALQIEKQMIEGGVPWRGVGFHH